MLIQFIEIKPAFEVFTTVEMFDGPLGFGAKKCPGALGGPGHPLEELVNSR